MESVIKLTEAPAILKRSYSYKVTADFEARGHKTVSAANFEISAIEGYTPLLIHSFSCGTQWIEITWVNLTTSGAVMGLCTADQSAQTTDFYVYVTICFVRNDLIG